MGAKSEFEEAIGKMDQQKISTFLQCQSCDLIKFEMNVPSASHMGGVWERQIRTVRSVLEVLLDQCTYQLDDESLRTFMYEAANIVNSRPLCTDNLTDPQSPVPLTPNHILTMKSQIVLPPPGNFVREDLYLRKKWKRVQYLLNVFWSKWKVEYLNTLQQRKKWNQPSRNVTENDIVLVKDENSARNKWPLGIVEEVYQSADNRVRKARVRMADRGINKDGSRVKDQSRLERPVHKLVVLLEADRGIPTEEPK